MLGDYATDTALIHGGDVLTASRECGLPAEDCLDLSTGISPYAYPCNHLPLSAFTRLPYPCREFLENARQYYGSEHFLALPGTQSAIQMLPAILPALPILLPSTGYQEHQLAWLKQGNPVSHYASLPAQYAGAHLEITQRIKQQANQHVVIINPNNPSTLCFSPERLTDWAEQLGKDAYLIVDEAFIDTQPELSVIPHFLHKRVRNIIVLRSFGKFFGLAGIRLGFVFAPAKILSRIQSRLPLWSINGPAQYIAQHAFIDRKWQSQHQRRLQQAEKFTIELFAKLTRPPYSAHGFHQRLFSSYLMERSCARTLYQQFYQNGVLLRLIDLPGTQALLRIGRLDIEQVPQRLLSALDQLR